MVGIDEIEIFLAGVPSTEREKIIRKSLQVIAREPESYSHLLRLADVYWRLKDWPHTIEFALRAQKVKPSSFHATKLLVAAYAGIAEYDSCYEHAKCLVELGPNDWRKATYLSWILTPFAILPKTRSPYHWWRAQCARESKSDAEMFAFANELIRWYEAPGHDAPPNRVRAGC